MGSNVDFEHLSDQVFVQINLVRTQPRLFLSELAQLKKYYSGNHFENSECERSFYTEEGVSAVDEAIEFLSKVDPLPELSRSVKLNQTANVLVEQFKSFGVSDIPEGPMLLENRAKELITENGILEESISFGWCTPKDIVLQFIVDDGETGRVNRRKIFSEKFSKIGVACGIHKMHHFCCVLDFFGTKETPQVDLSNYQLSEQEYPDNAVSYNRRVSLTKHPDHAVVTMEYVFTLHDGQTVNNTQVFETSLPLPSDLV